MEHCIALPIEESSQAGNARRMAIALASQLGFAETERGKVGIVATELANNLARHAQSGQLLLQPLERRGVNGIQILSLDRGPGMANISECLRDGYSTSGTAGNGLGAIARLSDLFEIHSLPQVGTAILCRLWSAPLPPRTSAHPLKLGSIVVPKPGEDVTGDAWAMAQENGEISPSPSRQQSAAPSCPLPDRHLLMMADGLGHGLLAAKAASEAVHVFHQQTRRSPKEILEFMHSALRSTRGAAVAIAEIHLNSQQVRFAGIGNIAATVITPHVRQNWVSFNGTIGHEVRKIQEYTYPWHPDGLLVMHSDGLTTQWRLDQYPGLIYRHPSLVAGVLYRDFRRQRDDVTVVVLRQAWQEKV